LSRPAEPSGSFATPRGCGCERRCRLSYEGRGGGAGCCCDRAGWRWGGRRRRRSARRTPRRRGRRRRGRRRSSTTPSTYRIRTRRTTGCAGGGYVRDRLALLRLFSPSNLDLRRAGQVGDLDCVMRALSPWIWKWFACVPLADCLRVHGEWDKQCLDARDWSVEWSVELLFRGSRRGHFTSISAPHGDKGNVICGEQVCHGRSFLSSISLKNYTSVKCLHALLILKGFCVLYIFSFWIPTKAL